MPPIIVPKVTLAEMNAEQNGCKVVYEINYTGFALNIGAGSSSEREELRLQSAKQTDQLRALEDANTCNLQDRKHVNHKYNNQRCEQHSFPINTAFRFSIHLFPLLQRLFRILGVGEVAAIRFLCPPSPSFPFVQLPFRVRGTSKIRDLDRAHGYRKVRRDVSRADPVPETALHQRRAARDRALQLKSKRKRSPKTILKLPDLEQSKSAVLNSLISPSSQRS